jgi:hypothetical protein
VRSRWLISGVVLVAGCSHPPIGSREALADTVHIERATGFVQPDTTDPVDEQPTVMFRCEGGKVGAYIVTGSLDTLPSDDQMVRIDLDSPPDC